MRKFTPTTPAPRDVIGPSSPDASNRRVATPTEFVGTIDGDGRERLVALGRDDLRVQCRDRGPPVGGRHEVRGHRPIVRVG